MLDEHKVGAKITVKLTKMDENGIVSVDEHEVILSEEEEEKLWQLQQGH